MRKKWLCLLMAAGLIMNVAACGGSANTAGTTTQAAETTKAEEETKAEETTTTEEETKTEETDSTETAENETGGDFGTGTWDGNVFTNEWLNIKITFPDGITIMTEDEIKKVVGAGKEVIVNRGDYSEAQLNYSEEMTVYDFMVTLPDGGSSVSLVYEKSAMGSQLDGEAYLNAVKDQLSAVADMQYECEDVETVELAGSSFAKLHTSTMGGALYQDYFGINKDGRIASIIVSYLPDSEEVVKTIEEGITTAH